MLSVLWVAIDNELVRMGAYVTALQVGKRNVSKHDAPPRIIVWWSGDTFGPAVMVGGKQREIMVAYRVCELRIHGATDDHVEGMRSQFIIALHKAVKKAGDSHSPNGGGGSYKISSGTVNTNTQLAKTGVEYKATFQVPSAIIDRIWDPPNVAPLPATYTGTQANTHGSPPDDLTIAGTVGVQHDPPDDDTEAVEIDVTK